MKWLRSVVIGLLLLACVLVAALFVALHYLPETDLIKNAVTDQLRGLTGNEIGIESIKVDPSFPDVVRFQASGITATSREGERLLSIKRLVLTPSLAPLLHREISITSVIVEGVRTTITRERDGSLQQGFLPVPLSSAGGTSETQSQPTTGEIGPGTGPEPGKSTSPASVAAGMKWSIQSVRVTDGRVDFVDKSVASGGKRAISLTDLHAMLTQEKPGNAFTMDAKGKLGGGASGQGSFDIKGRIGLTQDLSAVEQASAELTCASIASEPFLPYMPFLKGSAADLRLADTRCQVSWQKGLPASFSLDTRLLTGSTDSAELKLHAEGSAAPDFSGVEQVTASADTDRFPLIVAKDYVPREAPWNPDKGFLTTKVRGDWNRTGHWQVGGAVDLHDLAPVGPLAGLAKQVAVKSEIRLDSQNLLLQKLEITGANRLASIQGTITNPFSQSLSMDLTGQIAAQPQWLKSFGIHLPDQLKLIGPLPLHGKMSGSLSSMSVDLMGDLNGTAIQWNPYLEKVAGDKATLSVKGDIRPGREQIKNLPAANLRVRMEMPAAHVRLKPDAAWITGCALSLDSAVVVAGKTFDVKDAVLALKRGNKPGEVVRVTASLENLGSAHPKIKGTAHALIDRETIALIHADLPPNVVLTGETQPRAAFSGTLAEGGWSLDVPLTNLGIEVERSFRKAAGAASALKASGKWSKEGVFLDRGNLTLPGVSVACRGVLTDSHGKPGELTLDLKRADLKDLAKFVPSLSNLRASGPVEADVILKPSPRGMVPHAAIRLLAVDYVPEKAAWSLRKLHGTATVDGESLAVPDLSGQIQGVIEAPLMAKLTLDKVTSLKDTNGNLFLEIGKGRIKADRLRNILNQTRLLVGSLLNPQALEKPADFLELEVVTGDFDIKSGTAQTSNLRLKSSDFNLGAVGTLRLGDLHLDALAALHTIVVSSQALGKIPEVRKAAKKYEGLLKITGLDKELKRLGIDTNQEGKENQGGKENQESQEPVKTPVKVIVKLTGTVSSPRVTPVLETSLDKDTAERLKSLTN